MASKALAPIAFLLSLNLIFFTLVSSQTPASAPPPRSCADQDFDACLGFLSNSDPNSQSQCCTLLGGLVNLDAADCICTRLRLSVLGIRLPINLALRLLFNVCDKQVPSGYTCN